MMILLSLPLIGTVSALRLEYCLAVMNTNHSIIIRRKFELYEDLE